MFWWVNEEFDSDVIIPDAFTTLAGKRGPACVRLWPNGKTDPGWGMARDKQGRAFMENYLAGRFNEQTAKLGLLSNRWAFAFVMRSLQMVCIDIDGKNGGHQNIGKLGMLPPTLAEVSRSGDGYHLFYSTPTDVWDEEKGFALLKDRIGIVPGVDIRAVGCVFHQPHQRWNQQEIVPLPDFQLDTWLAKAAKVDGEVEEITQMINEGDEDGVLVAQHKLTIDLAKPIPAGKRNTTLFAIGSKMMLAQVEDWQSLVEHRAFKLGLDKDETDKLIRNIVKYGANA